MPPNQNRFANARKYLDLFEETWKSEHEDAMRCRGFEEFLAVSAMIVGLLTDVCRLRRESIYRGMEEPNSETDAAEKDMFVRWLARVEKEIGKLESLEQSFGVVEGAEKLRACIQNAHAFLTNWTPAVQALALGSRVVEFSAEDADQIHALLKAPPGSPGQTTRPLRSIPQGKPSLLK